MGISRRGPDPYDALRKTAPRSGPPVPNMGGMPTQPNAPQRTNLPDRPAVRAAPPGPAPSGVQAGAGGLPPLLPAPPSGAAAQGGALPPVPPMPPAIGTPPTGVLGELASATPAATAPAPQAAPTTAEAQRPEPPPEATPDMLATVARGVPTAEQLRALAPGQGIETEHGHIYRDLGTGEVKLRMNPAGKAAYAAARVEAVKRYGRYPGMDDAGAPPPPVEPGKPNFNPWAVAGQEWS